MKTLTEFIIEEQVEHPYATGELSRLLNDIGTAGKIVHREVNRAGLVDITGYEGRTNVQGERQKKLDVFANEQFIRALRGGGQICAIASEENNQIISLDNPISSKGKYVIALDPLDGSSNIEVNVSIGTIFSIYKRKTKNGAAQLDDLLQPGVDLVASGYLIYGSSTMMVYTTGQTVDGFTLDPSLGLYLLSHPNIRIPEDGKIYSINEGNYAHFDQGIKDYLKYCQELDPETNRPCTSRYIGSLVADFHRNMINGGIFMYPATAKNPKGKLRLLYECKPMAYLAEVGGGLATDGKDRILEKFPGSLHERAPLFIGSKNMMNKLHELLRKNEE